MAWVLAAAAFLGGAGVQDSGPVLEHFTQRSGLHPALLGRKPEGALRVMVGGGSRGGGSAALLRDLLEAAPLDAVAVGFDDLVEDAPDLRAAMTAGRVPFVCANVKGAGATHVIRKLGALRVALVGVTRPPAYRKDYRPARGWTIDDPAAALKALLPALAASADAVVLLAVMDRVECSRLLAEVQGVHVALVPSLVSTDPEPLDTGPSRVMQSPSGGVVGRVTIAMDGRRLASLKSALAGVEVSPEDIERSKAIFARHGEGVDADRLSAGVIPAPAAPSDRETGPLAALERGKTQPLVVGGANPSVEIRVESLEVSNEREGRKPPPGAAWLVVRSAWKNLIPLATVDGRPVPTAYAVGGAANNLYLVVDGSRLSMLDAELSGGKGGLLTGRAISIAAFGEVRRGDLVFPIPAAGAETLDLHFHDFQGKPIRFPLLARPRGSKAEEKPAAPVVKNELVEAAVFDLRREARLGDRKAPEGMIYVLLDFRARSTVTIEAGRDRVGVVGDLPDLRKTLVLKADGREVLQCEGTELPDSLRLLPDVLTGGRAAYLVPEQSRSLSLQCALGEFGLPDGRRVKPRAMAFPLDGAPRACPKCGAAAGGGDKFCGDCGTRLGP